MELLNDTKLNILFPGNMPVDVRKSAGRKIVLIVWNRLFLIQIKMESAV
jgi:hypothetical protein